MRNTIKINEDIFQRIGMSLKNTEVVRCDRGTGPRHNRANQSSVLNNDDETIREQA